MASAQEIADWPCETPMVEALSVQDLTGAAAPAGDWQADAEVRAVVLTASDPENPPDKGKAVIEALARDAAADRLQLVLAGLVDESNDLRRILIDGIRDNVLRAKVVAKAIADNDAALAALPADADATQREELEQAKFWNKRGFNKAKDDAEMLCHRLSYLDKKTRALAESAMSH